MRQFCRLYGQLDRSEGIVERVRLLADHLGAADPADAAWTVHLLLGKQRRRLITAARLRQAAIAVSGLPAWLLEACHSQVGDTAETIALLLAAERRDSDTTALDPWSLQHWMEVELPRLAALGEEAQAEALQAHWKRLASEEVLVLNKLLTGAFRVGVGPALVVRALARSSGVEEARLQHRLMGDFLPSADAYRALVAPSGDESLPPGQPYPFLLACPLDPARLEDSDPAAWLVEWKWDGIRGQLIRRAGTSFLWSRGQDLLNGAFPELIALADQLEEGTVLDGEVLIWPEGDGQPRPFAELQRRLGRRQIGPKLLRELPARYVAYDLLEARGEDLRSLPLQERRQRLEQMLERRPLPSLRPSDPLALPHWPALEEHRHNARAAGAEGVMVKALASTYVSGRRQGHWWKHKLEPLRLDAVLLYARSGSGRRANLYTDYTFGLWAEGDGRRLVSFASAYSGLNDAEILELDRWIRRHTTERFGPVRAVEPELVFELAFEGVRRSGRHRSGLAVRFPRISRWRRDKPAAEADTVAAALALIQP